jgi:hypothetical protein
MTALSRIAVAVVAIVLAALLARNASAPVVAAALAAKGHTYGMRRYIDPAYGFSFWYPAALRIKVSKTDDAVSFPGGVLVETLEIGPAGGVTVHVVNSLQSTITDEPTGHASPIGQTKYFYDASARRWMVTSPEDTSLVGQGAIKPADVSKATIGGQPMLPAGARFDTTIIPLSTTRFIVIQDGGGSTFTVQLAQTVAAAGASVDPSALAAALQAEAAAYKKQ